MYPYSQTLSVPDFWKLLTESGLLLSARCALLADEYGRVPGVHRDGGVKSLAEWLVARREITGYQARLLLSGRSGPFLIAGYLLLERVGHGRFAGFYLAEHRPTGQRVLLQFPSKAARWDRARWQTNRRLADLRDPHVIRCYESVEWQEGGFLVFERVAGESLRERLQQAGRLSPEPVGRLAVAAARGLAAIHRLGRPHGDVRPENIWCSLQGPARLVWDGAIDLHPLNFTLPETAAALRNRADYLAPEFIRAGKSPDARTDIYALGCTLYEALAGQPPFPGGTLKNKLLRHAREPMRSLAGHGVSAELERCLAYMMAKNPPLRFQDAQALADQLAVLSSVTGEVSAPLAPQAFEEWLAARRSGSVSIPPGSTATSPTAAPPVAAPPLPPAVPIPPAVSSPPTAAPPAMTIAPAATGEPEAVRPSAGDAAKPSLPRKRRRQRPMATRQTMPWILAFGSALAVLSGAVYVLNSLPGPGMTAAPAKPVAPTKQAAKPQAREPAVAPVDSTATDRGAAERSAPQVIDDDGQLLWASPTSGPPLDLSGLPPGGQLFVVLRPAEVVAHVEGAKTMRALGAGFASMAERWESASGCAWDAIEQLTLAVYHVDGAAEIVSRVRLREPMQLEQLLARWDQPVPDRQLAALYRRGSWAYYVTDATAVREFLVGSADRLREAARGEAAAPAVPWHVAKLLQRSDSDRHATVVFCPGYFTTDGHLLWDGAYAVLEQALEWLIGDNVRAGVWSLHWGDAFYCELRLVGHPAASDSLLLEQLRSRWSQTPDWVEDYLARIDVEAYWRRVALRIPSMLRFVRQQSRFAVERGSLTWNCVMPDIAAHNLAGAGELLARSLAPATAVVGIASPSQPRSLDELLEQRFSIRLGQESLETALQALEEEVRAHYRDLPFAFSIRILGKDLQAAGITRNQPIRDFVQQQRPLAEILTALVMKANPVTTVRSPSEPQQTLVWVIGTDPDDETRQSILITTRQAAEGKLPIPFRTPASR